MRPISFFCAAVFALGAMAQVPDAFTYQAVARAVDGTALADQSIGILVSIRTDSLNGTAVFSESHTTTSNAFGVFSLMVGKGTAQIGDFSSIDWGASSHFLNVEMDPTGGTNYQDMGSTQIMSVPYAQFAKMSSYDMGQEVRLDDAEDRLDKDDDMLAELLALIHFYHPFNCGDPLTDVRDGKTYATVDVGGVCWMAENLNYDLDSTGASASDTTVGPTHVDTVGRYYSWVGALDIDSIYNYTHYNPVGNVRGVCPIGWHLPSDAEWNALYAATNFNQNSELMVGGSSGMEIHLSGRRLDNSNTYSSLGVIAFLISRDERPNPENRGETQIFNVGALVSGITKTYRRTPIRCIKD